MTPLILPSDERKGSRAGSRATSFSVWTSTTEQLAVKVLTALASVSPAASMGKLACRRPPVALVVPTKRSMAVSMGRI